MTTTLVSWRPQVVYMPVLAAHRKALLLTAVATKALTPTRTGRLAGSVKAFPTGEFSGRVGTKLFYGRFVAGGAKPHDIIPKRRGRGKHVLAGPGFGPFARVHSPGTEATHFVQKGAATYRENLLLAGRVEFLKRAF